MRIPTAVLALSLLTVPSFALAEPVYLKCDFSIDSVSFGLDEQNGSASILITSSGSTRTVPATFTPDKVIIDESDVVWTIDRRNLNFSREFTLISSTDTGHCEIQAIPKRKF
ncbi:hypothetical protein [Rhizobium esperanzae]|uniref:hypothetical protein n=1 Tax=Rhizobium esperanzae TaxID=1967781 RepID=UPI001130A69A|nr:hypothetical protein [Rhizobium esperanzae]